MTDTIHTFDRLDVVRVLKEIQHLLVLPQGRGLAAALKQVNALETVLCEDHALDERQCLGTEYGEHVVHQ